MKPAEFITHVENTLGWMPPADKPYWKVRAAEIVKLKRKMGTNRRLYTWDNLLLAVEMLRREKAEVASPAAVCWHVPRAVAAERQQITSDLAGAIHAAITEAFAAGEPDWVERLARAQGSARHDVLAEWKAHHGS